MCYHLKIIHTKRSYEWDFLPTVEVKDYNVMIDRRSFFDQRFKNNYRIYDDIWKITNGQGDDCTASRLPDYRYFKTNYETIATDLGKQRNIQKLNNKTIILEI